ncbi:hypothetical protein ACJX0J_013276, partial [Zea mays]
GWNSKYIFLQRYQKQQKIKGRSLEINRHEKYEWKNTRYETQSQEMKGPRLHNYSQMGTWNSKFVNLGQSKNLTSQWLRAIQWLNSQMKCQNNITKKDKAQETHDLFAGVQINKESYIFLFTYQILLQGLMDGVILYQIAPPDTL